MPRGGKRPGAGRPIGSSVLDAWQMLEVGVECQRRWNSDLEKRLAEKQDAYFSRSDYREKTAEVLKALSRGRAPDPDVLDDVEFARMTMAGMEAEDERAAPRNASFQVARPYGIKNEIIADVAKWASTKFGRPISVGVVRSAWAVLKRAEADDV